MIPKANDEVCIADIPTTHGSSHVEITNEDNDHHFLRYQGYSLLLQSTIPVNHASYVEILKRLLEAVNRKRPELWPNDWILHHGNAPAHKTLFGQAVSGQKIDY
jgi:hypothetical protein